ncbi:MAG TPA: DUF4097 family beta strand repeat-containing protein [Symbiobacteriaceae bacterium]|nr:DUF4097 family beta strand repeat-containing protein [Symbiobacteriaceae bacterium]
MKSSFKVGRITVALGLVAFGLGLLLDNLGVYLGAIGHVSRLWPLLLIGFGIEYLVQTIMGQRSGEERKIRWDVGGAFLLIFIVLLSTGITAFRTYVIPQGGRLGINIGPSETRNQVQTVQLGNAKELIADVKVGSVSLRPNVNNPGEVRVDATYTAQGFLVDRDQVRRELDQIQLEITEGETIRISANLPSQLHNVSVNYVIYAPDGLKVRAQSGAGRIDVSGYKGDMVLSSNVGRVEVIAGSGTLNVNSGSGYIGVSDFQGPVDARTNVGGINLRNVVGTLQLESRTGSIDVDNYHGGNLIAETGTGRINVNTDAILEGNVSLKTQTGSIGFTAPKESSVRVTAQTRTGSLTAPEFVNVTRTGPASSASGTSGDGKYTVSLEANTGAVNYQTR